MRTIFFLYIFTITTLFGADILPVAKKGINYKSKIYPSSVLLVEANGKYKCKKYLDLVLLKEHKYYAKHYISKNKPICAKDVYTPSTNIIRFRFGNLEIEKMGEIITETDRYIKIKNLDGTIEKIYKDGQNR